MQAQRFLVWIKRTLKTRPMINSGMKLPNCMWNIAKIPAVKRAASTGLNLLPKPWRTKPRKKTSSVRGATIIVIIPMMVIAARLFLNAGMIGSWIW